MTYSGAKEVRHLERSSALCRMKWSRGVLMVMENEIEGRKFRARSADRD
jgi:hypothetical protein